MQINTYTLLNQQFGIHKEVLDIVSEAEAQVSDIFQELEDIMAFNQYKVLDVFQQCRISDTHFGWNTGYGYNDAGREALENVYAKVFKTEAALVRPIIVSGTHALTLTLSGILRPGDELIYSTGRPYDTLEEVIGIRGSGAGSLKDFGITYNQVELKEDGSIDYESLRKAISSKTRMVCLQRATGDLKPEIIEIGFEEIAEGLDKLKSGGIKGRMVAMIKDEDRISSALQPDSKIA
jgi:cystathionine beta-lyase family protein involved in aluminum resistance